MTSTYTLSPTLKRLCVFGQVLAVLLALFSVWVFFAQGVVEQSLDAYWQRLSQTAKDVVVYSDLKKNLLIMIATLSYFAPAFILCGAYLVFGAFRRGDPFRKETVRSVRFLGMTIIVYALSKIITYSLVVLVLTYDNPPGTKELSLVVNGHTLVTLMIGIIILAVGHILIQASKIAEENRQFI